MKKRKNCAECGVLFDDIHPPMMWSGNFMCRACAIPHLREHYAPMVEQWVRDGGKEPTGQDLDIYIEREVRERTYWAMGTRAADRLFAMMAAMDSTLKSR